MSSSAFLAFTDPHPYQTAIRAAQLDIFPTTTGDFRAELTQVTFDRLWMQRAHEKLPRLFVGAVSKDRAVIQFPTKAHQPPVQHCGMPVSSGEIIVDSWSLMHRRTEAACDWGSMSLTPNDLAAASEALAGRELTVPLVTHLVRPRHELMSQLLKLHETASHLARTTPDVLVRPEVARALEQALVHAMVMCLTEGISIEMGAGDRSHLTIIARLEEFLAANCDRSVYLADMCSAIGTSERTLRVSCHEYLGMGPIRYLQLRRLHLARRALMRAKPGTATVTDIATEYGFWELGRFSVAYRELFGELPSVSLSRSPDDWWTKQDRPSALPASEFA
jgi:AraC-like DNA-binding protein